MAPFRAGAFQPPNNFLLCIRAFHHNVTKAIMSEILGTYFVLHNSKQQTKLSGHNHWILLSFNISFPFLETCSQMGINGLLVLPRKVFWVHLFYSWIGEHIIRKEAFTGSCSPCCGKWELPSQGFMFICSRKCFSIPVEGNSSGNWILGW